MNLPQTPKDVTYGSGKKAWWICRKGHEWEAAVTDRSRGRGCPYCAGKKASRDNCLKTINPGLAKEWHPIKNAPLTPEHVVPGSNKKVWWRCSKGHEWEQTIAGRAGSRGCLYCMFKKMPPSKQ